MSCAAKTVQQNAKPLSWWTYLQLTSGTGAFWAAWWGGEPKLTPWRTPDAVGIVEHRSDVFPSYLPAVKRALGCEPEAVCVAESFAKAAMREAEDDPAQRRGSAEGRAALGLDSTADTEAVRRAIRAKLQELYKGSAVSVAARAQVAEALTLDAIAKRGPPILKATGGMARLLRIVDASGKDTGKRVTHGQVLEGAAKVADLELATQDGKRPTTIFCCDCPPESKTRVVKVGKTGIIPTQCKPCRVRKQWRRYRRANREAVCEKERLRARANTDVKLKRLAAARHWRKTNPEAMRKAVSRWHKANREALNEKRRLRYAHKKLEAQQAEAAKSTDGKGNK